MSNEETIKLKVDLSISLANAKQEDVIDTGIPLSEWNALTEEERQKRGDEKWREWIWEYIDGGWEAAD
ncbi:hypothetical protein ABZ897_00665 [Nonomuraea sp. NPDC046802]|uniref:DUF7167 family protein n=1 Tax=Nonomuraea sp. NPDC046802 TaxID=3154919 RepID=UPI0033E64703